MELDVSLQEQTPSSRLSHRETDLVAQLRAGKHAPARHDLKGRDSPSSGTRDGTCAYSRLMDDEALLERSRHGDRDAFAALVNRYQDDLYTMALRMLASPADAADVVQETFLRAYTRLPELRGASVRGWLFRVAVNCSHDVQRRVTRRPTRPLENAEGNILELPDPA